MAKNKKYSLHNLALIRAYQVCPAISKDISKLNIKSKPWLKPEILRTESLKYKKLKHYKSYVLALIKESKQNLPMNKKIELTQKALDHAKKYYPKKIYYLKNRLYSLAPHLNPKPKRKDYLTVALNFRKQRNFVKAKSYYNKVVKTAYNVNEKRIAYKGLHKTLKLQRKYQESLKPLKKLQDFYIKHESKKRNFSQRYINLSNEYARALWTYDHYNQAKNLLLSLTQSKKTRRVTLMETYWVLGRMSEERSQPQEAIKWFNKALKQKTFNAELKEKIRWYLAWNLRKTKDYPSAINILKKLIKKASSPYVGHKFKFWLAETYNTKKDTINYKSTLKELTMEDPLGYYGLLSQHRLGEKISPLLNKQKSQQKKIGLLNPYKFKKQYVNDLLNVGETKVAALYLARFAKRLPSFKNKTVPLWSELFKYFARTGDYLKLFTTIGFWRPSQRRKFLDQFPEVLFPKPFKETVASAAQKWKIEENYIYSIMRQESSFNPEARSHADAFGLLQLLPKHAARHHQTVGVKYLTPSDLFKPEVNVPVGAYFLKSLWKKHGDKFILATASYNANDSAIKGWIKTRYRGDVLSFIEDIPYEETRGYIKLVLRNYIVYSWLDNNQQPIDFPKHFLKI